MIYRQPHFTQLLEQERRILGAVTPLAVQYSTIMDTLRIPSIELAQRLHNITLPINNIQLSLQKATLSIFEHQQKIQEAMKPFATNYLQIAEAFKVPSIELTQKLHQLTLPLSNLQSNLRELSSPMLHWQRQMQEAMSPLALMLSQMPLDAIKTNIEELQSLYPEYNKVEYTETDNETVFKINNEIISVSDVSDALKDVFDQPSNEAIIKRIEALESSNLRTIIVSSIISFLIAAFFYILPNSSLQKPRANLHDLKQTNQSVELTLEQKKYFRFVYVKTVLHVRTEGYTHSDIIDILQPGTTVVLIEKNKNWALISYIDPFTNETHTGWVFSRYLRRFN